MSQLLPKAGVWRAAQQHLPPARKVYNLVFKTRFLAYVAVSAFIIIVWRQIRPAAGDMQRFVCWGPAKPPMEMSPNEAARWHAQHTTPITFNHHAPVTVNATSIDRINLNPIESTPQGLANKERILILTPLRNAAQHIPQHFDLLSQLTYPHDLIDLGFLVGDSNDDTLAVLAAELDRVQNTPAAFRSAMIVEKDFGVTMSQDVKVRHGWAAQGPRRMEMGKARNYLLYTALKPEHSWVYWRDIDIVDSPSKIIEDFIAHNKDILVPNIWFHRYKDVNGETKDIEGRFDYNSWQETDASKRATANLDRNFIIAEGYKEFKTHRKYMATEGDWRNNKDEEWQLDGIGGVNIMVKGHVHRSGINFPCYPFENQAETEGFAKMAKRAGFGVYGLPNYVVWHIDTEEKPGNS
ncbi:hypothetical protein BT63DRAFT_154283 [Microthyrium microscopicum]|uniref:Mannan polymerase II complex ANP1 subunit n=1 Tax=Microthyrium microscopicum TaxID=703497 RepID=A0A6A6UQK3_9PEZI|nr:hypothetical protein BT63DRAFT_154283 [Microthyrium microscopicum]